MPFEGCASRCPVERGQNCESAWYYWCHENELINGSWRMQSLPRCIFAEKYMAAYKCSAACLLYSYASWHVSQFMQLPGNANPGSAAWGKCRNSCSDQAMPL